MAVPVGLIVNEGTIEFFSGSDVFCGFIYSALPEDTLTSAFSQIISVSFLRSYSPVCRSQALCPRTACGSIPR